MGFHRNPRFSQQPFSQNPILPCRQNGPIQASTKSKAFWDQQTSGFAWLLESGGWRKTRSFFPGFCREAKSCFPGFFGNPFFAKGKKGPIQAPRFCPKGKMGAFEICSNRALELGSQKKLFGLFAQQKQGKNKINNKTDNRNQNDSQARDFADLPEFLRRRLFADNENPLAGIQKIADFFLEIHANPFQHFFSKNSILLLVLRVP